MCSIHTHIAWCQVNGTTRKQACNTTHASHNKDTAHTNTSPSNKHDRLLEADHEVQEEPQRGCLSCWHKKARHGHARVIVNVCYKIRPGRELVCLEVDKVVIDSALARDLDCGPCALPPLVKVLPAGSCMQIISTCSTGTCNISKWQLETQNEVQVSPLIYQSHVSSTEHLSPTAF